jgi:hypothetical protein
LKPGTNVVGVYVLAWQPDFSSDDYVDFRYVTINYDAGVKVSPNPASGQPDKPIDFSATMENAPTSARWNWDFGDGTYSPDAGPRQSHAYKAGKYTVKVTVYDESGKQAVVVATGQAPVESVSAGPDRLAEVRATKQVRYASGFFEGGPDRTGEHTEVCQAIEEMPVAWDGLNFSGLNRSPSDEPGVSNEFTVSGTVAPDGKSITPLRITQVIHHVYHEKARPFQACGWTFANIELAPFTQPKSIIFRSGSISGWSGYWGAGSTAVFVSGSVTTELGQWPIAPSAQSTFSFSFVR